MRLIKTLKIWTLLCALPVFGLGQTTIDLEPTDDARLWKFLPNNNYGSDDYVQTYPNEPSHTERFVLKFDLSSIPSGATISSATLSLSNTGTLGFSRSINVHAVENYWNEANVTWNQIEGNYSTELIGTDSPSYPLDVDATFDLTATIQNIADGTDVNNGWLFKDSNEDNSLQFWKFASSEYAVVSSRPKLSITYTQGGNNSNPYSNLQSKTILSNCIADAFVDSYLADDNFGEESYIQTYPWGNFSKRSLLKFDFGELNNISPSVTIDSAFIFLNVVGTRGFGSTIVSKELNTNWLENTVTWNNHNLISIGDTVSSTSINGSQTIVKIDIKNYIQKLVDTNNEHYGFLLKDDSEDGSQDFWHFASREHLNELFRPYVEITYKDSSEAFPQDCADAIPTVNARLGNIPGSNAYIPTAQDETKYIRVNIHYILHTPGNSDYPGNFTKVDDGGLNSPHNGYSMAKKVIERANGEIAQAPSRKMKLPPNNTIPAIETKYRYYLNGVFYHENTALYDFTLGKGTALENAYQENYEKAINVYYLTRIDPSIRFGGYANSGLGRYTVIRGPWENIDRDKNLGKNYDEDGVMWGATEIFNHEIGHNLSLNHTILYNNGACPGTGIDVNDYVDDTPSRLFLNSLFNGIDVCNDCGYSGDGLPYCSNNMMDYSRGRAITPGQLGRVHWTLAYEMRDYVTCSFSSPLETITSFTENKAYIAGTVSVPENSNVLVDQNNGLFVQSRKFEIEKNSKIEVKADCQFWVNVGNYCDQ